MFEAGLPAGVGRPAAGGAARRQQAAGRTGRRLPRIGRAGRAAGCRQRTRAGPTRRLPLGTVVGARSGDKAGSANLGVWVRAAADVRLAGGHADRAPACASCCPSWPSCRSGATYCPICSAVNFVIEGLLGRGVGYQARFDPQAKGLAEWLRSRTVDIPEEFLRPESVMTVLPSVLDTGSAAFAGNRDGDARQAGRARLPSMPRRWPAAVRSTPSATTAGASCWPGSGSNCCSTRTRRSWNCRRWRPGAASSRSVPAWSPASARSAAWSA